MGNFEQQLPLLTSLLSMFLSIAFLLLVFLIARRSYRDRFSSYWLIGWAFYAVRSVFEIIEVLHPGLPAVSSGNLISLCGSSVFLFAAAASLGRRRPSAGTIGLAFAGAFLCVASAGLLGAPRSAMVLVVFIACGAAQIAAGIPFMVHRSRLKSLGAPMAAISLFLLGALNLTYSWMRPDPLLAPVGYQLGTFLRIALGIAVAIILFDASHHEARRSAARYQALFNSLNDGVFIVDFTDNRLGKFLEVNDQATSYLGYTREELLGMRPADIEAEEDPKRGDASPLIASNKALLRRIHVSKRGERIPVDISTQVFDLDGRPVALGIARDVREREASEARLRVALGEKEVLLRELHHRVKNNLQVIVSLLSLQAETMRDPASVEALSESKARIASIALVHELLYDDRNVETIDLRSYIEELAADIGASRGRKEDVRVLVEGEDLRYDIEHAIPVGLILVELVTNAHKYAFRGRLGGTIRISIDRLDGSDRIKIEDDGVGIARTGREGKTLGLSLVEMLSKQLGGRIELLPSGAGTSWQLSLPSVEARSRGR